MIFQHRGQRMRGPGPGGIEPKDLSDLGGRTAHLYRRMHVDGAFHQEARLIGSRGHEAPQPVQTVGIKISTDLLMHFPECALRR